MEKKELFELMDHFSRSPLYRMKYKDGDVTLELEKTPPAAIAAAPAPVTAVAPVQNAAPAAPEKEEGLFVRAPLVLIMLLRHRAQHPLFRWETRCRRDKPCA